MKNPRSPRQRNSRSARNSPRRRRTPEYTRRRGCSKRRRRTNRKTANHTQANAAAHTTPTKRRPSKEKAARSKNSRAAKTGGTTQKDRKNAHAHARASFFMRVWNFAAAVRIQRAATVRAFPPSPPRACARCERRCGPAGFCLTQSYPHILIRSV